MAFALLVNLSGTRTLGRVAMAGFVAELIGALFVGVWLLRSSATTTSASCSTRSAPSGDGSYLGAFLASALLGLYLFYGFEACGDVAEEVPTRAARSRRRCGARSTSAASPACSSPPR